MNIAASTSALSYSPAKQASTSREQHPHSQELSDQQLQVVKQLKSRDSVVRAHEMAHLAAGSGITRGGASFSFQRGPDGVQYAVGGEVNIDASKIAGNPEATLDKALKIHAAALAPLQPSSQDRNVAAKAAQMAVEARAEIQQQTAEQNLNGNKSLNKNSFDGFVHFKV